MEDIPANGLANVFPALKILLMPVTAYAREQEKNSWLGGGTKIGGGGDARRTRRISIGNRYGHVVQRG